MPDYIRVKDKSTGHKYSIVASSFDPEAHQELKQPAVNTAGDPLEPEHAGPTVSSNQTGQKATTKENS